MPRERDRTVPEGHLVADLVLAVLAALLGGVIAQRLGQPPLLGYLLGGVAISPLTPGPFADVKTIQVLAEIGVAFLMFALGAEFSLEELRRLGRVAVVGGPLQIVGTMLLSLLLAPALSLSLVQGLFLGALLALSSTVVALKVLMARGEMEALHGRAALGLLLAQDLAVVPMVIVLPALAGTAGDLGAELGLTVLKAAAVVVGAYLAGARAIPWLLHRAAIERTRELFLLLVVVLAVGTALLTSLSGLSFAFGAFLAGLIVAESEYRTQVMAEVLPLRDLFVAFFFVSIGMLIDPGALLAQWQLVGLLTGAVVLGKIVITAGVVRLIGLPTRVALLTAVAIAQIGEFSFVLAQVGVSAGAIPGWLFSLMLGTALASIVLAPSLVRATPALLERAERLPGIGRFLGSPIEAHGVEEGLRHHSVICGFGRVGSELADALERRGFRYLVIELNPFMVRRLRSRGVPVIYGDASNPTVLQHAGLERARLLAVLIGDARSAEAVTRYARARYPRLDIVARAASPEDVERLRRAGATEAVQPEFEAGLEVIRHAFHRYGIGGMELANLIAGRRAAYYRRVLEEGRA